MRTKLYLHGTHVNQPENIAYLKASIRDHEYTQLPGGAVMVYGVSVREYASIARYAKHLDVESYIALRPID